MKTSVAVALLMLAVIALALLFLGGPDREFTTSSAEAYELYEQGRAQLYAVQRERATASFREAVSLDPDFAMGWAMLGASQAYTAPDSAEGSAVIADSLAARLSNNMERAKVQLVLSSHKAGRHHDADSLITYILAENPDDLLANIARANMLFNRRDDGATEAFHKVLEIEPNHAVVYNMLGYIEASQGNYDEALINLRKYAFMAPDLANPHDSLGDVLSWTGSYEEAEREFLTALKVQPDFYFSLINLGEIYMEQGMIAKGAEILRGVREHVAGTRQERDIDEALIRTYYSFGMFDDSLVAIDTYTEHNPDAIVSEYFNAIATYMRGNEDVSREHLDKFRLRMQELTHLGPEHIERTIGRMEHQFAAFTATARDDHATAVQEWEIVFELSDVAAPHELWWMLLRQGESYLAAGRPRDALQNAFKILEVNPRRIHPLLLMARAALETGETGIARKALNRLQPIMAEADRDLPAQQIYRDLLLDIAPSAAS